MGEGSGEWGGFTDIPPSRSKPGLLNIHAVPAAAAAAAAKHNICASGAKRRNNATGKRRKAGRTQNSPTAVGVLKSATGEKTNSGCCRSPPSEKVGVFVCLPRALRLSEDRQRGSAGTARAPVLFPLAPAPNNVLWTQPK